ncbi:amidohydrolase family protein [Pseudomonas aeruginosa]|uniref:amidohydrolase family protein n=1 Tax=Pseudomonas aeruginosa TaxID=287 RepID=UPI000EB60729|nr:amidohydrolase family protein [Pseudomonas aeruginosa]
MKRREFVVGAGVLAGASLLVDGLPALGAPGAPEQSPEHLPERAAPTAGRIDVHHHLLPPFYAEALWRQGLDRLVGVPLPAWTAEQSLALLEARGMQAAILSLPAPGVWFGDARAAGDLARRCNEYAAELTQRHPGRFGSFAALPLPATDQACAEAVHALDTLNADGVVLLASNAGVFLGDPRFEELMAELERREATVFVHPNLHPGSQTLALDTPGFLLEFVCDTTRAAVNLILGGTLERYPRIRWILAHAGGFLPYAAWRISLANAMPEFQEQAPQGVMTYLQRFYFDTALAPAAPSMAVLRELVAPRQVLFGSDFPFAPARLVEQQLAELDRASPWSPEQLAGIARGHALSLFPRFAGRGEAVVAAPRFESESTLHWLGRTATQPLAALAQRLKD